MISYLQIAADRAAEIPTTFRAAPRAARTYTIARGVLFSANALGSIVGHYFGDIGRDSHE